MKNPKKNLPIVVLETLEKYVNLTGDQFVVISPDNFLVKIIDKDKDSDFYFNIENYKLDNGLKVLIDFKPASKETITNTRTWFESKHLDNVFSNWINLLKRYETVISFFDDPILKSFADEYFAEFEIIDEDANVKPFNTHQILVLDEHLESIHNKIDSYKTDENESEMESIKSDIRELQNNLTSKTQKWVIRNLSKIWAKITKQSPLFLKDFLIVAKNAIIQESVKYVLGQGIQILNQ